jgi:hypothetical protein
MALASVQLIRFVKEMLVKSEHDQVPFYIPSPWSISLKNSLTGLPIWSQSKPANHSAN